MALGVITSPVEISIFIGVTSFPITAFMVNRIPGYSISSMILETSLTSKVTPSPRSMSLISSTIRLASSADRF